MTETHVSLSHVNICSEINPETYVGGIMPSILYQLSGSQENSISSTLELWPQRPNKALREKC